MKKGYVSAILIACLWCGSICTKGQNNEKPIQKKKAITITNTISKEDLGHTHLFKKHYPEHFTLSVNGKKVPKGKSIEVEAGTVTVEYDYEWYMPWGNKKAAKQATFEIDTAKNLHEISFKGWDAQDRIVVKNAERVSKDTVVENKKIVFNPDDIY